LVIAIDIDNPFDAAIEAAAKRGSAAEEVTNEDLKELIMVLLTQVSELKATIEQGVPGVTT